MSKINYVKLLGGKTCNIQKYLGQALVRIFSRNYRLEKNGMTYNSKK